jgi:hypothetical protein
MSTGVDSPLVFVVERFVSAASLAQVRADTERVAAAACELEREGVSVRHLGSLLVPADETAFCLFEGESVEAVRLANERAAVGYERIAEAVHVQADQAKGED